MKHTETPTICVNCSLHTLIARCLGSPIPKINFVTGEPLPKREDHNPLSVEHNYRLCSEVNDGECKKFISKLEKAVV